MNRSCWNRWRHALATGAYVAILASCGAATVPGFTLTALPPSLEVARGSIATASINVKRAGGFAEAVTVDLAAPPEGFEAEAVTVAGDSTTAVLTIAVSAGAAVGPVELTVRGSAGGDTRSTPLALTVTDGPPGSGSAEVPETTKVLDDVAQVVLSDVTDAGTFTFAAVTPVLQTLVAGDVLIAGVGAHTPLGALRRVEEVTLQGDGLIVETSPARLQDAFKELHLTLEAVASPAAVLPQAEGLTFPLGLSASDANGRVDLSGSLSVAPRFDLTLDLDISGFALDEMTVSFGAQETFLASLSGQGQLSFDESVTLGTVYFTPITLYVPTPSGVIIPIVLTPQVDIEAGVRGSLDGSFEASVSQEAEFTVGLGYRNGEFGGFSDSDSEFNLEQPVFEAAVAVKAAAGPRLEVLVYGAVGPFASTEAYVELAATAEGQPVCVRGALDAGITAKAGVDFLADYETTLLNETFPLAAFDSCSQDPNAPRPAVTWSRSFDRVGSLGERAAAVVEASDGTFVVVGDSTLYDGVTGFSASLWAMRLDALGNVMWQRAFRRAGGEGTARAVVEVPDGFVIATSTGFLAIDTGGNPIWSKMYNGTEAVDISSLEAHSDGSLIVAGAYGVDTQGWAAKLDRTGAVLWSATFGGESFSRARVTSDGGHILVGGAQGTTGAMLLVKLDSDGTVTWSRALENQYDASGGTSESMTLAASGGFGLDVVETPSGGFVVVGDTYGAFPLPEPNQPGHFAAWVAEVGADGHFASAGDGKVSGSVVYRAPDDAVYTSAYAVAVRPNGNTVVVGRRADDTGDLLANEDILILQGGAISVLGGSGNDFIRGGHLDGRRTGGMAIQLTNDRGLIVAATSNSFGSQERFWITKLGRTANIASSYLASLSGESYENPWSSSRDGSATATEVPFVLMPTDPSVEITQMRAEWVVP